jgi:uncharacterized membrane protein
MHFLLWFLRRQIKKIGGFSESFNDWFSNKIKWFDDVSVGEVIAFLLVGTLVMCLAGLLLVLMIYRGFPEGVAPIIIFSTLIVSPTVSVFILKVGSLFKEYKQDQQKIIDILSK